MPVEESLRSPGAAAAAALGVISSGRRNKLFWVCFERCVG
jgi:hypothetical protein